MAELFLSIEHVLVSTNRRGAVGASTIRKYRTFLVQNIRKNRVGVLKSAKTGANKNDRGARARHTSVVGVGDKRSVNPSLAFCVLRPVLLL